MTHDSSRRVFFVASVFAAVSGQVHWDHDCARAIENHAFAIAADRFDKRLKGVAAYHHSVIIDPWGTVLAELPDGPGVITGEIDLDHLAKVRAELPALQHRRLS